MSLDSEIRTYQRQLLARCARSLCLGGRLPSDVEPETYIAALQAARSLDLDYAIESVMALTRLQPTPKTG